MTTTPGNKDGHVVVTPAMRRNRGTQAAFNDKIEELRARYMADVNRRGTNDNVSYHLVLSIEEHHETAAT